jgi:endo-1,4-beta-xylanase
MALAFVASLQSQGAPVDGVGFQLHVTIDFSDFDGISATLAAYAALGLAVHFTEVDVACGGWPLYSCPAWGPDQEKAQALVYAGLLGRCLDAPNCASFETWGFSDGHSWLSPSPSTGDDMHPLPFDDAYAPKPAYGALAAALEAPALA